MSDADACWMRRVIGLARQAEGRTAPSPMAGAVVVRGDRVLAEGWRRTPDADPADVDALRQLPETMAPGGVLVTNRMPSSVEAILSRGICRVVVGENAPRGAALRSRLQDNGVRVDVGVEEDACRRLNAAYLTVMSTGRPLMVLKAGVTLDGRIADGSGASQWITGPQARAAGHQLRNRLDAVLVGSGTLLVDDPSLNTRIDGGRNARPVILDSQLRCPPGARVLTAGRAPLVFCAEDAPHRTLPAEVVRVPRAASGEGLSWEAVFHAMVLRNIHSVLVEGGGRVHRSLLEIGAVDRLVLFVAPKVLAGGPGFVAGPGFALASAPAFEVISVEKTGRDVQLTFEPAHAAWRGRAPAE
ncbi:MAG: bifunctional diaminohydroxyphosphoribosylaminopyrimidine deaminase/5-amino-6-(5-phosphoribosylamino)uracil reductase RibD [Myxococcota bacterium]